MTGKPVSYHSDRCWVAASNAASIELEKKAFYAIILQTTEDIQPESFCFIICCHQILLATRQALKLFTHGWRLGWAALKIAKQNTCHEQQKPVPVLFYLPCLKAVPALDDIQEVKTNV